MDTDPDHDGPAPEEAEEEVDEEAREAASQANIQAIIQEEFADLEENLNLMVGAGTITQDQAVRLARTVMEVSAGTRVTGVTLEETDLEETEGIARMDVVVRGPCTVRRTSSLPCYWSGEERCFKDPSWAMRSQEG